MSPGRSLATVAGISFANALLLGAALASTQPLFYLAVAAGVGTLLNLTYLLAGRLWQERP